MKIQVVRNEYLNSEELLRLQSVFPQLEMVSDEDYQGRKSSRAGHGNSENSKEDTGERCL